MDIINGPLDIGIFMNTVFRYYISLESKIKNSKNLIFTIIL